MAATKKSRWDYFWLRKLLILIFNKHHQKTMLQHICIFKIFIWIICACVSVSTISAQQINVEKFIFLENDLDARVTYPKKDQNNEVCALIKVVTKHTGFSFDIGSLGVVASEQKTGEIWVYIPRGAQKITIKHAQLGVLRNYIFPMPIESANVYEMLLTTADVEIVVKEKIIETQWLVITTEPSGANVFINDDYLGKTPYQGQLPAGDYNYRIENPQYHTQAGKIKITDKKEVLNFNLKANFGNITISSLPEVGMQIYLNNQNTGKTTPATLPKISSGKHTVKLLNEWYEPIEKEVEVKDEQTINTSFTMQAVFANIKIKTNANASIEINGVKRAEGEFNDRLRKGIYTVKLKHEQYYDQEFQLIVEVNKNQELSYDLKPKTGKLDVVSTPFDATIFIDNKNYGTSPITIKDLLIGTYNLKVQKEGFKEVQQKIEIKENETTKIDLKLEKEYVFIKKEIPEIIESNEKYKIIESNEIPKIKLGGPANALFDFFIPGLGLYKVSHTEKGQKRALYVSGGYLLIGLFAFSEYISYKEQYNLYLEATNQSSMDMYYDNASKHYKASVDLLTYMGAIVAIDVTYVFFKGIYNKAILEKRGTYGFVNFSHNLTSATNGSLGLKYSIRF